MSAPRSRTRIQARNSQVILDAALDIFSQYGFRGATLDQISERAGLSKPNLLYYFPSKEAMHVTLLSGLLDTWLDPLRALNHDGEPVEEILGYMRRKLEMSRLYPRESRLFANEILQGAPRILDIIDTELKELVEEKAALIRSWIAEGRLAPVDPKHLLFSIWATTQHYADFDIQVHRVLAQEGDEPYPDAEQFLTHLYRSALTPHPANAG